MVLCEEYKEYNLLREREKKNMLHKNILIVGLEFNFCSLFVYLIILFREKENKNNYYEYICIYSDQIE